MFKRLLFLSCVLLSSIMTGWAGDATYHPTLDVNFRTGSGNTGWNSGFPKDAADDGNGDFELNYYAGFFSLQKYTVSDLQNASKLVLTLTVGSKNGVDAIDVWSLNNTTWTAATGIDDIVPDVTTVIGVAPRSSEGTANTPLAKGKKVAESSPAKATFTIEGTALTALKANANADGTFTLLITNNNYIGNSQRSYLSSNSANDVANRPTLVATIETPVVINKNTGAGYSTLKDAWDALGDEDTELEVYENITLPSRMTWSKEHTLTITPKANITITSSGTNYMWFLANKNNAVLNIGSSDYTITLDGQNKTYGIDVTKYENNATIALKNVTFQNFDLNSTGHLVGSKTNEGLIVLDGVTLKNCKNPADAFVNKVRVTNDRVVLRNFFNIGSDCVGTAIYAASETKNSGTTGRIKVDDNEFTASAPITIAWPGEKAEDIVVVIGTSAANASVFKLTDDEWALTRKSNGDLVMAKPVAPTVKIGDTSYADLKAALDAAQDGDVITLLDDQELSARVNIQNKAITIKGEGHAIKRATGYTNGLMFLTVKPTTDEKAAALTLENVVLDGQNVSTTAAFIEASNNGTVTLTDVTMQNVVTTANGAIVNKTGGKLILQGNIAVPSIFVGKPLVLNATAATITTPIRLTTDSDYGYALIIEGSETTKFTCDQFRLSQQLDGVYLMPKAVAASYSHPALLHTAGDITRVKGLLTAEPFAAAYSRLESQSTGQAAGAVESLKRLDQANWGPSGSHGQYADYNNYTQAVKDAKLAYELALRYQLKGSTAAATAAVNILNNWATVNKGILRLKGYDNNIPDPNQYLITIQAYQFANAAELLRNYSGWAAEDFAKFQTWIRQAFADVAIQYLNTRTDRHYWLNWDLAALNALVSVGVLCDDKALVDFALDYINNGKGNGNKTNAVAATHSDPDSEEMLAQCQESGRDQGHSTLDVSLLGVLCQSAANANIGTDLFAAYQALEMAEYVGKYNLKDAAGKFVYSTERIPFTTYTNDEETHTAISTAARGTVRPCWELFHAYAQKNGKPDIYTEQWVQYMRQQNAWGEAESAATDELGFGTLMFGAAVTSRDVTIGEAGAATLVLPFGASLPTGMKAYTLSYTGGDKVTATEVSSIAANQPVLVNAEAGTYTFTSDGSANSNVPAYGALTGVYAKTVVPATAYILTLKDGVTAFRQADGTTNTIGAYHAYLTAGASAPDLLTIDFGGTTSISQMSHSKMGGMSVYNVNGQRITQPTKGVYIVNGKKYVVK